MKETRGRHGFSLEDKQAVYNAWPDNCIVSTDDRNRRNMIRISKRKYIEKFVNLSNESITIDESKDKRGCSHYSANRMVLTCTVRMIKEQLIKKGFSISLGTVLSLKPFFVTYPTEKEISLCLCKLCLNVKLLFEPLAIKAK